MKKAYGLVPVLVFLFQCSLAQDVLLFQKQEPVDIQMTGSIKSIKKESNDSTFVTGKFQYKNADGSWKEVPVQVRVRGNYRLKNCYFPPLKLKFSKENVASTLFEGNKSLKLVMPCRTSSDKNSLIRREYYCYKFYELVFPYYFRTRLANLALDEMSSKKAHSYELLAFFVEDNSMVAKRSQAKLVENKAVSPALFDEKQSVRNDFFQYMIGNADWSAVFQHNSNTLYLAGKYIPLSYDFDMAGFVNATYAHENPPTLGTGDPRERVYRGFCKSTPVMEEVRKEFLEKETDIQAIIDNDPTPLEKYDLKDMHAYLGGFFDILKNDKKFKELILDGCRTK